MADKKQQFMVAITCPGCGVPGVVTWEEAANDDRQQGASRRMVAIEGEFHVETGRTLPGDPLIICNLCDQIQPD